MRSDRTSSAPDRSRALVQGSESRPEARLPRHWEWWEDGQHDGVTNMATDDALLATVRAGVGSWRWYGWAQPTVSFGRNERVVGRITPTWLADAGLAAVRRPTGGRALLHARELTYSVTMPWPQPLSWRLAYDAINTVLLDALRTLGLPVERSAGGVPVTPDGPVCFDQPAAGELSVAGGKLVGSAVWRHGDGYLQHGSILLEDVQARLAPVSGSDGPPPAAAALRPLLPDHDDDTLRQRTYAATRERLQHVGDVTPFVVSDAWTARLASHRSRFADPAWLWRR